MFDKSAADVAFIEERYDDAAKMYREGAQEGSEIAAFDYGYCLLHGIGVAQDAKEAKSFFAYAKNMQGGEACYNLAIQHLHGDGVKCNYKLSFEYMKDSAALGCVEAMLYLGMAYTTGCMFEPDVIGICMIPYHKPIYRNFSSYLLSGDIPDAEEDEERRYSVVAPDAREAFLYFRAAARCDPTYTDELVKKAKFLYAKCFIDGLGVDFNYKTGVRLMLSAGKAGSEEALMFLREQGLSNKLGAFVKDTKALK